MNDSASSIAYERFTLKLAWQLAAPQTWPAALMPGIAAIALAAPYTPPSAWPLACVLLLICVLMQSAANMLNDYFDFKKGTDTLSDNLEADDAVLLHHRIDPRAVLRCAIVVLVAAFLLGTYPILVAGWVPLVMALLGAAVVVLYSCGKTPVSYLPIGEMVIGLVMGGLMPLACCYVLTQGLWLPQFIVGVLPSVFGVALILLTNNTCDIEKDRIAKRGTLSALIGREHARQLYRGLLGLWGAAMLVVVSLWYAGALFLLPFFFLACLPTLQALLKNPLENASRVSAMAQICSLNVIVGGFYAAAVFAAT